MLPLIHSVSEVPGLCDSAVGSVSSAPVSPTSLRQGEQELHTCDGLVLLTAVNTSALCSAGAC